MLSTNLCPKNRGIKLTIDKNHDKMKTKNNIWGENVKKFYLSAPSGVKTTKAYSQNCYYKTHDLDRKNGCIRSFENCYFRDGGLAVLYGNLAEEGCVVKVAGVDESLFYFKGKAAISNCYYFPTFLDIVSMIPAIPFLFRPFLTSLSNS